jgi:phage FluMu protein Com
MAAFVSRPSSETQSRFILALACGVVLLLAGGSAAFAVDCPPCDDGNACTTDTCDTTTGTCVHTTMQCPDDGNPCTIDQCLNGSCVGLPNSRAACDDHNACTLFDECVGTLCTGGSQTLFCQDGNPCTVDSCSPATGCVFAPINCDDGNPCTDDSCTGQLPAFCRHAFNAAPCDDGKDCSQDDHCSAGICSGTGILCPCDDRDGDGFADCTACDSTGLTCGDCNDADPSTHPGATDLCDGRDNDCNGVTDDPDGLDADGDGIGDACDNCPTIPNADQNPCACDATSCGVAGVVVEFTAQGAALVRWTTSVEFGVSGFNVVEIDNQGRRTAVTPSLVACQECETGRGAAYVVPIAKHKSGRNLYLEEVYTNGSVRLFGPAVRL